MPILKKYLSSIRYVIDIDYTTGETIVMNDENEILNVDEWKTLKKMVDNFYKNNSNECYQTLKRLKQFIKMK